MDITAPALTDLADFAEAVFDRDAIQAWAESGGGGLPRVSAEPFAEWLDSSWNQYDDGMGTQTNEDVLKSALGFWTGAS